MHPPFEISVLLDAPQSLVWDAVTQPEHLAHWFGPKGSVIRHSDMDFRVGGRYHYCADFFGFPLWGLWTFTEITPADRLVVLQCFSDEQRGATRHPMAPVWPLHTRSTTTLATEGAQTRLTLQWQPEGATPEEQLLFDASHASMHGGWSGSFEVLSAYLKTLAR
jgi:uncharacterized protein YndB with AHSA1/START domain